MRLRIKLLLLFLLAGLFTACTPGSTDTAPLSTLEVINLQITPELEHWMGLIGQCANSIEGIGVYTEVTTQAKLDISQTDLVLRLGQHKEKDPFTAVMGFEEVVLIGGNKVPIQTLSIESVRAIFSGEFSNWGDVPEVRQRDIVINQPIQTLSYPDGNILSQLFSISFLEKEPILSNPITYSTWEGLTRLLKENPWSIAYLLKSQLSEKQTPLIINNFDTAYAQQYVLAITNTEPEGKLKQLLLCLQNYQ